MSIWEYKVITSGSLGFATPQLLEQHLNQLGRESWEIIHSQTRADNPLAFHGLARRPVGRDWTAEAAAMSSAGASSGTVPAPPEERTVDIPSAAELRTAAEERRESLLAREESLRPLRSGEEDDDLYWLNRNARGELWLNARASKYAEGKDSGTKFPRRGRKKEVSG